MGHTLGSLVNLAKLWFLISIAVVRRVIRRVLLGPTLPSWGWRTDITVAIARTAIEFAATVPDDPLINKFGLRVRAPVPSNLRNRVRVTSTRLGAIRADRYIRLNHPSDHATMLYFHGGGYVFGNPGTHRQHLARLVDRTAVSAYAPTYRLAPIDPFPAALDDAVAAYRSLLSAGVPADEIIVSGDSAGGGLTLALLITLRDTGVELPRGAVLFSPYTDVEHTSFTIETNVDTDYLPRMMLDAPNEYYTTMDNLRNPVVSPVHADLSGLPPMLVLAGGAEMILDDSIRLVANAERDGVDVSLVVGPEMVHVWPAVVPWEPASSDALDSVAAWVDDLYRGERADREGASRDD